MNKTNRVDFLNSKFIFLSLESARDIVARSDVYSRLLTRFDLEAKVKSIKTLSEQDYLHNAKKYLYSWHDYEIDYITHLVKITEQKVKKKKYKFDLPDEIFLIKSAMHEEGGANGFTRANYIAFNLNSLSLHLFEHELFHIISRYNEKKIGEAYKILGFKKCNEVEIPTPFIDFKITNPDAPFNNYYIQLKHNKTDIEALMILYSKSEYSGGGFFSYLNKGLLVLVDEKGTKKASVVNGKLNTLGYDEVEGLFSQIGKNTGYNIHQEELSADHFTMCLNDVKNLPDQHLVDQLNKLLKK
ncbi:hypothetical protein [Ekhidna sp.]|uniref:hypothetical protein n=1 Tax=Ekhidna sp. TaxID=2608089 RepID=UPI00329944B7